jgi:hypothetical protein
MRAPATIRWPPISALKGRYSEAHGQRPGYSWSKAKTKNPEGVLPLQGWWCFCLFMILGLRPQAIEYSPFRAIVVPPLCFGFSGFQSFPDFQISAFPISGLLI